MITLSAYDIAEKNKTGTSTAWLHLLEIIWPQNAGSYRATDNNEDVTWDSYLWYSKPLIIGEIPENLDEVPQCTIAIENIDRETESSLWDYAYYTKTDGIFPVTVRVMLINSGNLAATTPTTTHEFELQDAESDNTWVTLTCGVTSPFRRRFPDNRLLQNQCQYARFKSVECGYTGAYTTCDRTLETCRLYGNSKRYGGFPGVGDDLYRGQ